MRPQFHPLSRLPKAKRWTSINDSDQLPGLVASLFGFYEKTQYGDELKALGYGNILDPSHPAAKLTLRQLPFFRAPAVGVNIYPKALLARYARPYGQIPHLTWDERVQKAWEEGFTAVLRQGRPVLAQKVDGRPPAIYTSTEQVYPKDLPVPISVRHATPKGPLLHNALKAAARRVPMAQANATSKKRVGSLAFVRSKIAKRLNAALHLITTRGAQVVDGPVEGVSERQRRGHGRSKESQVIVFDEDDAGIKWSMQGWAYIWYPTSAMYNMPLTELIPQVRLCLENVNRYAKRMDNNWMAEALLRPASPPNPSPPVVFPGPITQTVPGIDPKAPELVHEDRPGKHQVERLALTSRRKPPSSTGNKPQDVWEKELAAGLAILKQSSRDSQ